MTPTIDMVYQDGSVKAVDLSVFGGLEGFLKLTSQGDTNQYTRIRSLNPWYDKGVTMTANQVISLPCDYTTLAGDPVEKGRFWGAIKNPETYIRKIAASLCNGAGYLIIKRTNRAIISLQYVLASSMTPEYDDNGNVAYFLRTTSKGKREKLMPDEVIYFWPADDTVEIGPAQITPLGKAFVNASLLSSMDATLYTYAERGWIKPTLGKVKGMPGQAEREKAEKGLSAWMRGTWKTVVKLVNAESLEMQELGIGMDELRNTYQQLTDVQVNAIGSAFGIPAPMFRGDDQNRATAETNVRTWLTSGDFVNIYSCIQDTFNEQVFKPMGLMMTYDPTKLDAFKVDETEGASAFATITDTFATNPEAAVISAEILGFDLTDDQKAAILALGEDDEPEPQPVPPQLEQSQDDDLDEQLSREEMDTAEAMRKWMGYAQKNWENVEKRCGFAHKSIPALLWFRTSAALRAAKSADELPTIFERIADELPAHTLAKVIGRLQKEG